MRPKPRLRVLIVDDDPTAVDTLRLFIEAEGFEALQAYDGRTALAVARDAAPDVILLDVMLPDIDGFTVCRQIRGFSDSAILLLTAKSFEADRIHGLQGGADDYIVKPYSAREVVARIHAVLRRTKPSVRNADIITVGQLCIDTRANEAKLGSTRLSLTPTHFRLLAVLARNAGTAISRAELIDRVLGNEYEGLDRTLDVHVGALRKRLSGAGSTGIFIATKFGFGYSLEEQS